jgi:uncharacterized protein (UPF0332 family)
MSEKQNLKEVVQYWIKKANDSLCAAEDELEAGRLSFSVNRIYYACFYVTSAVLLQRKFKFSKHSGVRTAFHQYLVKTGQVSHEQGQLYDELFEARLRGDYIELVRFEKGVVEEWLKQASEFVRTIRALIK